MNIPAVNLTDGYKVDHRRQYPADTNLVYSNLTARKSRFPDIDETVFFGLQYLVKEYLIKQWRENFFQKPLKDVVKQYTRRINNYLGPNKITFDHIEYLHSLGHLPIIVKAVKEGTKVPINKPMMTIYNTDAKCFWITNYLETIISCIIWQPICSATLASQYRKVFDKYADETVGNRDFVQFQGHDFSFRGMGGLESACISGAAHLLSFAGTDTIPAIDFLEQYYGADSDKELVGCSVAATEHSVMCMGGDGNEIATFRRLINEVYPSGIVSIVSDTWDFWKVITEYLPILKDEILARDGKVVIRPDSGDPVKICCGDPDGKTEWERKGAIECLWDTFGGTVNTIGPSEDGLSVVAYNQLDSHIGLIYGDSITLQRQDEILSRLKAKRFSSTNMVFGIGSYTYQYQTRDSFGMAKKATYGEVNGVGRNIFKDPATDTDKMKKSHKGLMRLNGDMSLDQEVSWEEEKGGILEPVFVNGRLVREQTLADIRRILND